MWETRSEPARPESSPCTRQAAVKAIAPRVQLMVVVGAPNSSNSLRLVEVAERAGCPRAVMVQRGRDLDPALLEGVTDLGVTAGASAPEALVQELLGRLAERYELTIEERRVTEENVVFRLPAPLV